MKTCSRAVRTLDWGEGSPSNRTPTLSTQPRQHRSDFGTSLWMSLSGPARDRTWNRSNISGEAGETGDFGAFLTMDYFWPDLVPFRFMDYLWPFLITWKSDLSNGESSPREVRCYMFLRSCSITWNTKYNIRTNVSFWPLTPKLYRWKWPTIIYCISHLRDPAEKNVTEKQFLVLLITKQSIDMKSYNYTKTVQDISKYFIITTQM